MKKSNVYESEPLICDVCGKNLFDNPGMSIIVFFTDVDTGIIKDVKLCCKGQCDRILKSGKLKNYTDGWREVSEFINPYLFIKNLTIALNNIHKGEQKFDDEAYVKYRNIILKCYPYVSRDLEQEELSAAEMMWPF